MHIHTYARTFILVKKVSQRKENHFGRNNLRARRGCSLPAEIRFSR